MNFRVFILLSLLFLAVESARSQIGTDTSTTIIPNAQEIAEPLLDQIETESDQSEILDRLNWLQEHPFDLNTVSKEQLATIPGVTAFEALSIVSLRKQIKKFTSVGQIGTLDDGRILPKVRPYVAVEEEDRSRSSINMTSRTSKDLQQRKGFQDASFAGSPFKTYNRITLGYADKVQSGILFEKDAGERVGESFLSGYLALKDWLVFSQVVLGDYTVEAGQGLVLWRSSAFGKGSEAVSVVKKSGLAAQPYRSSDEFNFLRGVAVSSEFGIGENTLSVTGLFSKRSLGASGDEESVSSFYKEGLYRTDSERNKISQVHEKIVGGRASFASAADWNVGTTFYHTTFDKPITADRLFEFSGSSATIAGVDAEINLGWLAPGRSQITIFGEAARAGDGADAGIVGSVLSLTKDASMALIYRNYSPQFTALHAAGFGERSETKNERGFYIGTDANVSSWLHMATYIDHFKFPWRTFTNPLPTSGRDLLLQFDASLSHSLTLSLRYSNKLTETSEPSFDEYSRDIRLLANRLAQKMRLTATLRASKRLRLKGRLETALVDYSLVDRSERGYLMYQEMQYAFASSFTTEVRLIFFDTDSYDSRLYEYENDLRGVFSNPALYGKGRRWYVLLRWNAADVIRLSAKYTETQYDNRTTISSGVTEIQGDLDNKIALQVEIKF